MSGGKRNSSPPPPPPLLLPLLPAGAAAEGGYRAPLSVWRRCCGSQRGGGRSDLRLLLGWPSSLASMGGMAEGDGRGGHHQ